MKREPENLPENVNWVNLLLNILMKVVMSKKSGNKIKVGLSDSSLSFSVSSKTRSSETEGVLSSLSSLCFE